ncbi:MULTISPECIES: hypothetical protein [Colwellia]|nr:hypothetical protein [Colwellia sp. D2M02]
MRIKKQLRSSHRRKQLSRQQHKMVNRRQFYFNQSTLEENNH